MLPIKVLDLLRIQAGKLLLNINLITPPVVTLHPEVSGETDQKNTGRAGEVEAVADGEVRAIVGRVGPGRNEPTNVAKHDLMKDDERMFGQRDLWETFVHLH